MPALPVAPIVHGRREPDALHVDATWPTGRFPLFSYSLDPRYRPHVHPVNAPGTDRPISRFRPSDHPWQYAMYTGLNKLNGFDFWCCEENVYPPDIRGRVERRSAEITQLGDDMPAIDAIHRFIAPGREVVAFERLRYTPCMFACDDAYLIDIEWELTAGDAPADLPTYEYGGFGLRLFGGARLHQRNADGAEGAMCQGTRSRWLASAEPVDGVGIYPEGGQGQWSFAGAAMFDHPANFAFPSPWRVGEGLLNPSPQLAGGFTLAPGESRRFRYAVLVFLGDIDVERVDRHYDAWATT